MSSVTAHAPLVSADRNGYVDTEYLDTVAAITATMKQRTYELLQLKPDASVLDVGCGPATDTLALAKRVGPGGRVVGVDLDAEMLERGSARAAEAGVEGWVRHEHARATALPFADATFDAARSERVFQHLSDPDLALDEMRRVTRRGGRIVVADTDWASLSIYLGSPFLDQLERRLNAYAAFGFLPNGASGRQLRQRFTDAGLTNVSFEPFTIAMTTHEVIRVGILDPMLERAVSDGHFTAGESAALRAVVVTAADAGVLFGTVTLIVAAGTRS